MWFTNLQLYRFTKSFTLTAEDVIDKLAAHQFRPCGSLEMSSYGWVPPLGRHGEQLVHVANGRILLCARKEEKVLPAAVVREIVAGKVEEIEDEQARPVRRREREDIRDEVMLTLLPKAFTRSSLTFAYLSPQDNLIIVNASSAKKAEELLNFLRRSLGTLPIVPPILKRSPADAMTGWLNCVDVPDDFIINDECELRDPGNEGGVVRCKRQDLGADEIQGHLSAGKKVVKLAVTWNGDISCLVSEDLSIKRLRFEDVLQEQSDMIDASDVVARFDNDFNIMTLTLSRFVPRLLEVLGGEKEDAYAAVDQAA